MSEFINNPDLKIRRKIQSYKLNDYDEVKFSDLLKVHDDIITDRNKLEVAVSDYIKKEELEKRLVVFCKK